MYMSCFRLKVNAPSVVQCLRDAHDLHRSVMKLFPNVEEQSARKELGVLYRLYRTAKDVRLYLVSRDMPDAQYLSPGFEMIDRPKDLHSVLESFASGNTYRFDLMASPTKKAPSEGKNSKRVFLTATQDRFQWLTRKAQTAGFQLVWLREEGQETVHAALRRKEAPITFVGVHFCGVLKVTDETAFRKAYAEGIGSQRAYGMGMLLLTVNNSA